MLRNLVQLGRFDLPGSRTTDRMRILAGYTAMLERRDRRRATAGERDAGAADSPRRRRAVEIRQTGSGTATIRRGGTAMAEAVAISVVIPVYNEVKTIGEVIRRVLDCGFDTEVIVVDDASTDGTREFLKQLEHPNVHCFYHAVNRGKGAALRLGFAAAKTNS